MFITGAKALLLVCLLFNPPVFAQKRGVARKSDRAGESARPAATGPQQAALIEKGLKEAVRSDARSFAAHHNLGEFYIQQGNLAAAIPYLEEAQRLDPAHYANGYDLALLYFQTGRLPQARAQLQRMIRLKDAAELHSLLGDVEDGAGNLVAAAEAYERAARMEESEDHLLDLGNSLIRINAFDAATQIFQYGLGKYPRSAKLRVGMGIAHYSRGQYDDAVKTLCEAVDLDPTDARAYLFLGEMYGVSVEMAEEITRRMAQFAKHHPKNALAHYYFAVNLRQGRRSAEITGDLKQIETLLKTAIALDPKLALAHYELGVFYADQQRDGEAIEALRNAVEFNPDLEKAHYRLARLYQRAGQSTLAAKEMEIFQRLKERRHER